MNREKRTLLAADAAVLRRHKDTGELELLMIRRAGRTFHGYLAFPGGFVEYDEVRVLLLLMPTDTSNEGARYGVHKRAT